MRPSQSSFYIIIKKINHRILDFDKKLLTLNKFQNLFFIQIWLLFFFFFFLRQQQRFNQFQRVLLQLMKYLESGLKKTDTILLDHSNSQSQIQSDIQDLDDVKVIGKVQLSRSKFCPIVPIRKKPIFRPQQKSRHKLEEIQVIDSQHSNISQEESDLKAIMREPENHQTFKKKLVKVSNKCKIERKQYSSTQCSICLGSIETKKQSQIGRLHCKHAFCFECIFESSKFSSRCPYCRSSIQYIKRNGQKIPVEEKHLEDEDDPYDEPCYVCGRNDDFDHLLECEYCQAAFCHTYCDNRLESDIPPEESWYCLSCSNILGN